MKNQVYTYPDLKNVYVSGTDIDSLTPEEQAVLYHQARYCQAMTDADINTMRELVSEDKTYTHMSGMTQTREQYFSDVQSGALNYFQIGIENPVIRVEGNRATLTYTSALTANAYGARGTFHMKGTHFYEKQDGRWIEGNEDKN